MRTVKFTIYSVVKGLVIGKYKKTLDDITKTESGNLIIPLNNMAITLLMQIQDYNKRMKKKTDYVARTAEGGYVLKETY